MSSAFPSIQCQIKYASSTGRSRRPQADFSWPFCWLGFVPPDSHLFPRPHVAAMRAPCRQYEDDFSSSARRPFAALGGAADAAMQEGARVGRGDLRLLSIFRHKHYGDGSIRRANSSAGRSVHPTIINRVYNFPPNRRIGTIISAGAARSIVSIDNMAR